MTRELDNAGLTENEKALMIMLWAVVKSKGGTVSFHKRVMDQMEFGVDKLDSKVVLDGQRVVLKCIR